MCVVGETCSMQLGSNAEVVGFCRKPGSCCWQLRPKSWWYNRHVTVGCLRQIIVPHLALSCTSYLLASLAKIFITTLLRPPQILEFATLDIQSTALSLLSSCSMAAPELGGMGVLGTTNAINITRLTASSPTKTPCILRTT